MGRNLRRRLHELLEAGREGDRASRVFDVGLIVLIAASLVASIVESLPAVYGRHQVFFDVFEMACTAVFTVEYVLRVAVAVEREDPRFHPPVLGRLRYMATPMALADLLAVLPFYLAAWAPVDLRVLRVLRLLRIFKLAHYFNALGVLLDVLRQERSAFGAAYFVVSIGLVLAASGVYIFEHRAQPDAFGSVPHALWWAIATLTTVGYGDVTPITTGGRVFGSAVMMLGVGMVAIPTGILATGFALELQRRRAVYGRELESALADGVVDAGERDRLEALRRTLDLGEDQAEALEAALRQVPRASALASCPHCGELLEGEAKRPPGARPPS